MLHEHVIVPDKMRHQVRRRGQYILASLPFPFSQQLPRMQAGLGKRKFLAVCLCTPWLGLRGPEADGWSLPASPHSQSHFSVPRRIPFSSVPWLLESQARPVWKQRRLSEEREPQGEQGLSAWREGHFVYSGKTTGQRPSGRPLPRVSFSPGSVVVNLPNASYL